MFAEADQRLEQTIEEVHLDALRHPDPSGQCLLRVLEAVEVHGREESASVTTYARIGRETRDPVVAAVMELLVEDEQRHHALLVRIATSLRDRLVWASESSALPCSVAPASQTGPETVEMVHALEREKRRGAQQLRDAAYRERSDGTGLSCLLLEALAADSDKHAHLLAFVAQHLIRRPAAR